MLEDSEENYKESENQIEMPITNIDISNFQNHDIINSEKNQKKDNFEDDIPEELKEVFREDEKNNSSTEVPK